MTGAAPAQAPIGLIAGQGRLPVLVAEGMKQAGRTICGLGFRGSYDAEALQPLCSTLRPISVMRPGSWIRQLRRQGVTEAVMVGRVAKTRMHDPLRLVRSIPDWRAIDIWYRRLRHDRRNAAVLAAIADELTRCGVTIIDSTSYIPDHLAEAGVMGRREPSAEAQADIEFAWPLLEQAINLDIGQAMAVRERDIIAVEAVEGTDVMIDRAGSLCRAKGWTLLKTARADHDTRADVPTIGVSTVERLAAAGGRTIALGAGRVILVDKPEVIAAADRLGVALIGRTT